MRITIFATSATARRRLSGVPKAVQQLVATMVRSIFARPDAQAVRAQHGRVMEQLQECFADTAVLSEKLPA